MPADENAPLIRGSIVALVTPMEADGGVDFDALGRLVDFHVAAGTAAILSVGTTGESATLDMDEHQRVIAATIAAADGRLPVLAGTGANSTREALELTENAAAAGADACLLVTPYYNKPTQEGLYRHFQTIAEAVAVPQILYNVPGRTACDMDNDTVERLAAIPNIIGIKDASNDVARGVDLVRRCGDGFSVWSGEDAAARELILGGGHGVISVSANVAPKLMAQMTAAALAGDAARAEELDRKLAPVHRAMFVESNPIPAKWALAQMGLMEAGIRLPLTPLSARFHEEVRAALRSVDALQ